MAKNFHSELVVANYDEHIRKLIPGYELVHQQIDAILTTHLPEIAHILVVGCGTGYELSYLLQRHPNWIFTAIDPSATMLEQAIFHVQDDLADGFWHSLRIPDNRDSQSWLRPSLRRHAPHSSF